jgi:hypothetical protein
LSCLLSIGSNRAFKASVIKRLDELEKSALLELQTASQDSISQMEREESELEKSASLIEKHLQQLDFLTKICIL